LIWLNLSLIWMNFTKFWLSLSLITELIPNFTKNLCFKVENPKWPQIASKNQLSTKISIHFTFFVIRDAKIFLTIVIAMYADEKKNVIYVLDIKSHSHLSLVSDTIHASVCLCKFLSYMQACMFITLLLPSSSYSVCASSREIKKSTYSDTNNRHYYYNDCHYHKMDRRKKNSLEHSQQRKSRSSESQTHTNENCEIFLFPSFFTPFFGLLLLCCVTYDCWWEFFLQFFYFVLFLCNFFTFCLWKGN